MLIKRYGFAVILWLAMSAFLSLSQANDLSDVQDCDKNQFDFELEELLTQEERIAIMSQEFDDSLTRFTECTEENSSADGQSGNTGSDGASGSDGAAGDGSADSEGRQGSEQELSEAEDKGSQDENVQQGNGQPPASTEAQNEDSAVENNQQSSQQASQQNPIRSRGLSGGLPEAKEEYLVDTDGQKIDPDDHQKTSIRSRGLIGDEPDLQEATKGLPGDGQDTSEDGVFPSARQLDQDQDNDALDNGKLPDDIPAADNDSIIEKELRQAAQSEKDPRKRALLWNQYRQYKGLPVKPIAEVSVSE